MSTKDSSDSKKAILDKMDFAIAALIASAGDVKKAAEVAKVRPATIARWKRDNALFQERYAQARQDLLDRAIDFGLTDYSKNVAALGKFRDNPAADPAHQILSAKTLHDGEIKLIVSLMIAAREERLKDAGFVPLQQVCQMVASGVQPPNPSPGQRLRLQPMIDKIPEYIKGESEVVKPELAPEIVGRIPSVPLLGWNSTKE